MADPTPEQTPEERPDKPGRRARRRRRPLWVRLTVGATVAVLTIVVGAYALAAWSISTQVAASTEVPDTFWRDEVRVVDADRDSVTIRAIAGGPTWLRAGRVWGLDWGDGWGQVGEVLADEDGAVRRRLVVREGRPPRDGVRARYTREAFPRDATRVWDDATEVRLDGPDGSDGGLPAWFVPGRTKTWAVLVHGRGAARSEMFRLMSTTVDLGMPSLAITYRSDPESGGGETTYGQTEWADVETAVEHAREQGARDVVLVGASLGGAIIASFLERSDRAGDVRAVVMDSPLLDFPEAIDTIATRERVLGLPLPSWVASLGVRIAGTRVDQDLTAVDHLDDTDWVRVPVLVVHGTADATVPAATSQQLADQVPDKVQLHLVDGAGHVESWNREPEQVDRWLRELLS